MTPAFQNADVIIISKVLFFEMFYVFTYDFGICSKYSCNLYEIFFIRASHTQMFAKVFADFIFLICEIQQRYKQAEKGLAVFRRQCGFICITHRIFLSNPILLFFRQISFQQKSQKVGESIEFAVEADIFVCQFNAVFDI